MATTLTDFTSIRSGMIEKRDKAIADARSEYAATLVTAIAAAVGL